MANTISATPWQTSRTQIGKFRVLHELDLGAADAAYVAEDPHTRRAVVIRLLPIEQDGHDAFFDDVHKLMRLEHEHIAAIQEAGQVDDHYFLVMDLLKGESLAERLKREHRLPLKEGMRIAREMAAGLGFVHANGFIHRDVCPQNVWLEPGGRVRLLGLGTHLGGDAQLLLNRLDDSGKPGYLSPEQAAGEEITPAADLFSLGCVLYQMLTGEKPFRGEHSAALYRAVIFEHPSAPKLINPEVPAAVDELIGRLLAKLPSGRPASAAEVEQRLLEWLGPIVPRPAAAKSSEPTVSSAARRILETIESIKVAPAALASPLTRDLFSPAPARKARRNWWIDLVAAVLLIAGAGGLFLWWKASHNPPQQEPAASQTKQ
jgi:serine/threonine protein kinase